MQLAHIESANCQESRSTGSVITRETNRSYAGSVGEKQLLEWNVSMKKRSREWRTCGTEVISFPFFSFFLETNEEIRWENYVENNEKVKNNKEFSLFDKH